MKREISVDYFDPSRTELHRHDSLNILLVATNHTDTEKRAEIVFYGDDGTRLIRLHSEIRPLPPRQHSHLYFRLPEGFLLAAEGAEELRLFAAADKVTGREKSRLIFLQD